MLGSPGNELLRFNVLFQMTFVAVEVFMFSCKEIARFFMIKVSDFVVWPIDKLELFSVVFGVAFTTVGGKLFMVAEPRLYPRVYRPGTWVTSVRRDG